MNPSVRRAVRRTALYLSLLLGVVLGSFLLFNVVPGDPARLILGPSAPEESVRELRHQLGTDQPLWAQARSQLSRLIRLDFGRSVIDGRSVAAELGPKFWITARIGIIASLLSLILSYLINAGVFYYPRAQVILRCVNFGAVAPAFFTGVTAALLFGVWFPVIPLAGLGAEGVSWTTLLLPAIVVSLSSVALMTRILHEELERVSRLDFARAAKAFGLSRSHLFHRTLLRPVGVVWLAAWINQISIVFIASFVIEVIFSIPGIGSLLVRTIQQKDYPMLQGILLVNASFFLGLSWLSALLFAWIDPRAAAHEN